MANRKNNETAYEFPAGVAQPAIRALAGAGYTRLDQLAGVKAADLLKLHGMGPKALGLLEKALHAQGRSFAAPEGSMDSPALQEPIFDSPTGWVKAHIQSYVESKGENGQRWRGLPTLLLTTRGRKSGKLRRTALIYGQDGQNYLLVASNGGAPRHPSWYLNLAANQEVEIQVGADRFAARARTAGPDEKPRLWQIMSRIFAQYNSYQAKAGREIPLVILERI